MVWYFSNYVVTFKLKKNVFLCVVLHVSAVPIKARGGYQIPWS